VARGEGRSFSADVVGSLNVGEVIVGGKRVSALIDSGSMVTLCTYSFFLSLQDAPPLLDVSTLNIDVNVADGAKLDVLGYIETTVSVPFLSSFNLDVPVLVVPDNLTSHVVIGTNVIRRCKSVASQGVPDDSTPEAWQTALTRSLASRWR